MKLNLIASLIILLFFSGCVHRTLHPDQYHFKASQLDVDYGIAGEIGEKIVFHKGYDNNTDEEQRKRRWKEYSRSPEGWLKIRLATLSQSYNQGWITYDLYMQRVDEARQGAQNWVEAIEASYRRERAKQERKDRAWENAGRDGVNWANQYMNSRARGYNPAASAIRAQNTMPRY